MDWGAIGTWAAVLVAIAALWVSIRSDRRNTRSASDSAADAKRSADAAERAADAADRQATLAEAQATKYVPPWEMRWNQGDTFLLTNAGDDPEYDVKVELSEDLLTISQDFEPQDIDPHSSVKFWAMRHMGSRDDTVTVTWHHNEDRSDDRKSWRHPLPPKPR